MSLSLPVDIDRERFAVVDNGGGKTVEEEEDDMDDAIGMICRECVLPRCAGTAELPAPEPLLLFAFFFPLEEDNNGFEGCK